jgi:hypothetical protein
MVPMGYMELLNKFGFDIELYVTLDGLFVGLSLIMLVHAQTTLGCPASFPDAVRDRRCCGLWRGAHPE